MTVSSSEVALTVPSGAMITEIDVEDAPVRVTVDPAQPVTALVGKLVQPGDHIRIKCLITRATAPTYAFSATASFK